MKWQLRDASDQFVSIVEHARREGPQTVTAGDERVSVILSPEDYDALRADRLSFVDQLLSQSAAEGVPRLRKPRWSRSLEP